MSIVESGPFRHYALRLNCDGAAFAGFQSQPGRPTIQGAIENALAGVLGREVAAHGASRTDAGVHALAQVASFKARCDLDPKRLRVSLNAALPPAVRVVAAVRCASKFHARWSASGKVYRYCFGPTPSMGRVDVTPLGHPGLLHGASLPVDEAHVRRALGLYLGRGTYMGVCGRGPEKVRSVTRAEAHRAAEDGWEMWFEGTSFGRFMIRNLAGLAIACGMGLFSTDNVTAAIGCRRQLRGLRAPAQGLTLWSVRYPSELDPFRDPAGSVDPGNDGQSLHD